MFACSIGCQQELFGSQPLLLSPACLFWLTVERSSSPSFPLNSKLLDEGWIDHGNVRVRVDQAVSSRFFTITDNPERDNLQENLGRFSNSYSSACARRGSLDTLQGWCNAWDVCDFDVVCLMISISLGRTLLVKQCAVGISTCNTLRRRGDLHDLDKYSEELIQLKELFFPVN